MWLRTVALVASVSLVASAPVLQSSPFQGLEGAAVGQVNLPAAGTSSTIPSLVAWNDHPPVPPPRVFLKVGTRSSEQHVIPATSLRADTWLDRMRSWGKPTVSTNKGMAELLRNRARLFLHVPGVRAMTTDMARIGNRKILQLKGGIYDDAAISAMIQRRKQFYVENGHGKIWSFRPADVDGNMFTWTDNLGTARREGVLKALKVNSARIADETGQAARTATYGARSNGSWMSRLAKGSRGVWQRLSSPFRYFHGA